MEILMFPITGNTHPDIVYDTNIVKDYIQA